MFCRCMRASAAKPNFENEDDEKEVTRLKRWKGVIDSCTSMVGPLLARNGKNVSGTLAPHLCTCETIASNDDGNSIPVVCDCLVKSGWKLSENPLLRFS